MSNPPLAFRPAYTPTLHKEQGDRGLFSRIQPRSVRYYRLSAFDRRWHPDPEEEFSLFLNRLMDGHSPTSASGFENFLPGPGWK
jgi:hypothetical protein